MSDRFSPRSWPLVDTRTPQTLVPASAITVSDHAPLPPRDQRGRPLRDLRISVTDRCNFRCTYCMPKDVFDNHYAYLPHSALLSFEEITRLAQQFVALGVQKIRLTGGEPLLRKNIERLIAQLAQIRTPEGKPLDLTLTTNGALLAKKAASLRDAGLSRVTVSLDALEDAIFRRMNDVDFPVASVLEGISAAQAAGLGPIKVNMVVKKGLNDTQITPMARHFRGTGITLRFIEYMDVGNTNGWNLNEVISSAKVIDMLQQSMPLIPLEASAVGETAQRWGYATSDGRHDTRAGEVGVISSVTQAFCKDCTRARLSTEGRLYLCLFAATGYDLRALLRNGNSDTEIQHRLSSIWAQRSDNYSELRTQLHSIHPRTKVEMSHIGG